MKRTEHFIALLCLLTILAPARLLAQQGKNVNLKCSNMPLPTALYKVEQQSDYYKMNFNADDMKTYSVTADIKDAKAPAAVEQLLKGLPFASQVKGRIIQINRKANGNYILNIERPSHATCRPVENTPSPLTRNFG